MSKNLFGVSPSGAPPLTPQRGDRKGAPNTPNSTTSLIFTAFSPQPQPEEKILSNYISDEFIFKNIPTIDRQLYLQNRRLHPWLASLIIAQDQAPVPQQVPNKERRNYVVQRPIRSIVTANGLLYPIGNKDSDPTVFFRRSKSSTAIEKNYREGFNDVRTTKTHIIEYSKARFPCDADGNVMADLARLHDVTNGWMMPIKVTNERTAIFGWNRYEGLEMGIVRRNVKGWGRELDVAMKYRLRVLLDWKEKGCPLAEMFSVVYPEYVHLLPRDEPMEYEVPPPAAAALQVPSSPAPQPFPQSENVVSPMRAPPTQTSSGDNTELSGLRTEVLGLLSGAAKCIKGQSETVDKILTTQGQQSKDMGKLESNMATLVDTVTTGFNTINLRQGRLEHDQHELRSTQDHNQEYNNSVHVGFHSRLEALEIHARRNGGGAVSSPAPLVFGAASASATASAADEEMADSSSPSKKMPSHTTVAFGTNGSSQATAPAPVPQVSVSQPAPSTDQEMADSSPSKKMPSNAGAAAPQTTAATSNEAASSPFASVSASSSVQAVTSPKKIPASCSSQIKTTTPTEPIFNMGFTPPKENKKKNKGIKKTARRSPKAMKRPPSAPSPKKKTNVMRNNLVSKNRKKMAAPSPVKKPASDISKSVTPKDSTSAPVAPSYGTQLVNGTVIDWKDPNNHTNNFCAEELLAVTGSAFKYDNVSQYCAELTSGLPNDFQKVAVLFQHVVDTGTYEKLVDDYITGLKTFRCGSEARFEEEIKKGIDIAKLKGGMK